MKPSNTENNWDWNQQCFAWKVGDVTKNTSHFFLRTPQGREREERGSARAKPERPRGQGAGSQRTWRSQRFQTAARQKSWQIAPPLAGRSVQGLLIAARTGAQGGQKKLQLWRKMARPAQCLQFLMWNVRGRFGMELLESEWKWPLPCVMACPWVWL